MPEFTGTYTVAVDGKGRIAIPAKLRAANLAMGSEKFYATVSIDGGLDLYPEQGFFDLKKKLSSEHKVDTVEMRFLQRTLYSNSAECVPDSQGRILLSKHLKDYAGIEKEVLIMGAGMRVEIWNEQKYKHFLKTRAMQADKVVEDLFGHKPNT